MSSTISSPLDELKGSPTTPQILLWMQTNGHTNAWLARHLGIDAEDVRHCLEEGFDEEDLQTIADLMTHPKENLGQ